MIIKIKKLYPDAQIPKRGTAGAVAFDVSAYHVVDKDNRKVVSDLPQTILSQKSLLIGVGFALAVPFPIDGEIRPRSGLANRFDIEMSNSPGTIDPDFRGEMGILLRNRGERIFTVEKGMRIAQMLFKKVEIPQFVEASELPSTTRNQGGFGSTGLFEIGQGDREYQDQQLRLDRYFMNITICAAALSNCLRGAQKQDGQYLQDSQGCYLGSTRRVGCIIVKDGNIIGQGYNVRTLECTEERGCIREIENIPSGTMLERGCLHAEEAAVTNCLQTGVSIKGATVYVNFESCLMCSKVIAHSGITALVVPQGKYSTNGLQYITNCGVEVRYI